MLLDMRRVEQHQFEQFAGGFGGIDGAVVAAGYQARQQPAVVEVSVRNHYRLQAGRVEGEGRTVAFHVFAAPLAHAAFQQHLGAVAAFDQVAGAGYLLDGSEKGQQGHACSPSCVSAAACQSVAGRPLMQVSATLGVSV